MKKYLVLIRATRFPAFLGDHDLMTTVVRPWFGWGSSNLARQCDRRLGSG
jgi:hypothetical protein